MDLLIRNVTWLDDSLKAVSGDVRISRDVIVECDGSLSPKKKEQLIDLSGHCLYAGLINSHDHLEMNLYPKLGTPPYNNYTEWSKDIYNPSQSPIKEIEKTDIDYRLMWGGLKNLISGVTTVIHHNPWRRMLGKNSFPVIVPQIGWAHSLAFDKKLPSRIDSEKSFVIHAAEGIDDFARNEIHKLNELGLLKNNTVVIHGVGAGSSEWDLIRSNGASLVWCPSSNLYMFNRTADIRRLGNINVGLGTDSTLTGAPTLLDEMRVARETGFASMQDIFKMTGSGAASIFNIPKPGIRVGGKADLFIAPKIKADLLENLFSIQPKGMAMVMVSGDIKLQESSTGLPGLKKNFRVQNVRKETTVDVDKLKTHFEQKVGKDILDRNALWGMLN